MRTTRFTIMAIGLIVLLSSCHQKIWDTLNDHEARIARLEALCNQYNTTISSLQELVTAMQSNNYIKDVVPVMENGVAIGYTITFLHGDPVTIYNGKKGEDGQTPIVGVKKAEDGNWYWTLDGDWLLSAEGEKIPSGGITPRLKIEDDFWWVSYDSGATWDQVGNVVNGGPGNTMFREIRQDDKFVYFVLFNGETITIQKSGGLTWVYV